MSNNTLTSVTATDIATHIGEVQAAPDSERDAARQSLAVTVLTARDSDAAAAMVAADRSGRAVIRASLTAAVMAAAGALDIESAGALAARLALVNAAAESASGTTAAPIDWQALITARATDLIVAGVALLTNDQRPAGMPDDAAVSFDDSAARDAIESVMTGEWSPTAAAVTLATARVRRGGQTNSSADILATHVPALADECEGGYVRISVIARAVAAAGGSVSQGLLQQAHAAMLREDDALIVPGVRAVRADDAHNVTHVNAFAVTAD